jgi:hypothetical protein
MKLKLRFPASLASCFLLIPLGVALAQPGSGPAPSVGLTAGLRPGALDPATGLPLPLATPEWKDPDWPDPDITLTNLVYDSLPLSEVARDLRDKFKEHFDVLLPVNLAVPFGAETIDPGSIQIGLRLKNVTASEVFNAMNLVFENDRTPVRWELKLNGKRPIALLRLLAEPARPELPPTPPEPKRMVYFVGDLLGDAKSGGMTIDEVVKTVEEVCQISYGKNISVQFHKAAQLVVVSGSPDQIGFVERMLSALREKAALGWAKANPSATRPQTEAMKPGGAAPPR